MIGMSFKDYCKQMLHSNNGTDLDFEEMESKYNQAYGPRLRDFAVLYCLKALLSPLVESLIAIDRVLYILESSGDSTI